MDAILVKALCHEAYLSRSSSRRFRNEAGQLKSAQKSSSSASTSPRGLFVAPRVVSLVVGRCGCDLNLSFPLPLQHSSNTPSGGPVENKQDSKREDSNTGDDYGQNYTKHRESS